MNPNEQQQPQIPSLPIIDDWHDYRIIAARVPENECYIEKLVLLAMPGHNDAQAKVVGQLCVSVDPSVETIEWIEVDADNRRKGVARRLWTAAEKLLGRTLVHDPVTPEGEAFADALEARAARPVQQQEERCQCGHTKAEHQYFGCRSCGHLCDGFRPLSPPVMSKSVQKRVAVERGEPYPFDAPPAPAARGEGETTFHTLREANAARHVEWWDGLEPMTLAFRGNELAGEVGEACNIIKKLERERLGGRGTRATKDQLAEELADVHICADLIAMDAGIDLDAATAAKFNATSEKYGLSVRLASIDVAALTAERDKLKGEIETLEKVVERLPTTADNVPITPAMNVFTFDGVFGKTLRDDVGVLAIEALNFDEDKISLRSAAGDEWDVDPDDLYSTREAALAALANKNGAENGR